MMAASRSSLLCWVYCVVLLPSLILCDLNLQNEVNDIQSILRSWQPQTEDSSEKTHDNILWGLPDAKATVGKVFTYTIPDHAFNGQAHSYKVNEVGKDSLPHWLTFDHSTSTFRGIPSPSDLNLQHYIEVTAFGKYPNETKSNNKDMFGITVNPDDVHSKTGVIPLKELNPGSLQPIRCPSGSSVTMATVVIDADADALSAEDKLSLVDGLCKHLQMPASVVRLLPAGGKPLFDSSALVAGPGDVKETQHAGVLMEWEVGCGNVQAAHMPILTQLEATAHDGSMRSAGGHGIVGWHVTNHKPPSTKRFKRQVKVMATSTPDVSKFVPPTIRPDATVTISDEDTPETREIPTETSPSFTGVKPSRSRSKSRDRTRNSGRRSRKKTRTKTRTKCRHCNKTHHPKHTPSLTASSETISATAAVDVIRPTSVLEEGSSIEPSITHIQPSYPTASPGVSRSVDILQPSITITHTSTEVTSPTEILPTRSYEVVDVISTAPVTPIVTPTPQAPSSSSREVTRSRTSETTTTSNIYYKPVVKHYLPTIRTEQGKLLNFVIPESTFQDFEDGFTRNLDLIISTPDGLSLPRSSWIQLNKTSQTLYGLPMGLDVGSHELLLSAIDSTSQVARQVFEVEVMGKARKMNMYEFALTLDADYDLLIRDMDMKIELLQKIASLFGDQDASYIQVTRIDRGSVVFAWTNSSLPSGKCPVDTITQLSQYIINPNGTITAAAIESMKPYTILKAESLPLSPICEALPPQEVGPSAQVIPDEPIKPQNGEEIKPSTTERSSDPVWKEPRETSEEDILLRTIIPAVVIGASLLICVLIACILYRKNRKGKLSNIDQHTFITKGIPIIFAEELEDRPEQTTKPLILDDEKPPLPPPEYPGSSMSGSQLSTPRSDHKQLLFDTDTDGEMTPYQPPGPPMSGSLRGSLSRSRNGQQPAYRNPPPYVPP